MKSSRWSNNGCRSISEKAAEIRTKNCDTYTFGEYQTDV